MKKIALVTGAIGGIGTSICKQLIDDGYFVIGSYRAENIEKLTTQVLLLTRV
mgnify:CR=1 FL=1